ncbi:MAG: HI1506-related protein [Humidesulfovibrio sp.]|nr:HI1506-related protein [Humidesulfovibrio sp.]
MPVTITAKRNGFRRCGIAHSDKPVEHPDGTFTDEQLEILKAEPMLVVQDKVADNPLATMTKDKLAALLTERGVAFDPKAKKDELLALASALPQESGNTEE